MNLSVMTSAHGANRSVLGAQVFDCGLMGRVGRFIDVVGVEGLYVLFGLRPMRRKQR